MTKRVVKEVMKVNAVIDYQSWKKLKMMSVENDMEFNEYVSSVLVKLANKKNTIVTQVTEV